MENNIDKRNILDEEIFTYKITKDNKVFIYWNGQQVTILRDTRAKKLLDKIENASAKDIQLSLPMKN